MRHISIISVCFLLLSCSGKLDYESLLSQANRQYAAARYDDALRTLIAAEKHMDETSLRNQGLTYIMKGAVHQAQFEYDEAIIEYEKALEVLEGHEDSATYIRAVSYICDIYIDREDVINAGRYLEILGQSKDYMTEYDRDMFYMSRAKYAHLVHGAQAAVHEVEELLSLNPDEESIPWRIYAYYYNSAGCHEEALEMMKKEVLYNNVDSDPHYHYVLSEIHASTGDYESAYKALRRSGEIDDSLEVIRHKSDTRFMDERMEYIDRSVRDQTSLATIIVLSLMIITGLGTSLRATRKRHLLLRSLNDAIVDEKERIEKLYAEALVERDTLSKMSAGVSDDMQMKSVIKQRLSLLNKVITSYITDTSSANLEANRQLESLVSDREQFLETTRRSFDAAHPRFMAYLRSCGLTEWEMNYCCLYLVGLNGKEIGEYINLKRHYTYGSVIRHKLGLGERDRNLANHLKDLLDNPPASNPSAGA